MLIQSVFTLSTALPIYLEALYAGIITLTSVSATCFPSLYSFLYILILYYLRCWGQSPNYDTYGLFRATHSHLRSASVRAKHVPLAHSTLVSSYIIIILLSKILTLIKYRSNSSIHIIILIFSKSSTEYNFILCICQLLILFVQLSILLIIYWIIRFITRLPF